jgi:hypothetical protein
LHFSQETCNSTGSMRVALFLKKSAIEMIGFPVRVVFFSRNVQFNWFQYELHFSKKEINSTSLRCELHIFQNNKEHSTSDF